jgi:hypothetical protein
MSEELARTDWAEPEVMAQYRSEVNERASSWLSVYPNAKRRVELHSPEKAAHAVYLLTETDTKESEIAEITGLAEIQVRNLCIYRPELWDKRKPKLADKLATASEMAADAAIKKLNRILRDDEKLDATSLKDIALTSAIFGDKAAAFNGQAGTIIEYRSGPSLDDAMKAISDARAKLAGKAKEIAVEAEVTSA